MQALASGVGPSALRFVQSKTENGPLGQGAMFIFAGILYLFAVAVACALPKELVNSANTANVDDEEVETDYSLISMHGTETAESIEEESSKSTLGPIAV